MNTNSASASRWAVGLALLAGLFIGAQLAGPDAGLSRGLMGEPANGRVPGPFVIGLEGDQLEVVAVNLATLGRAPGVSLVGIDIYGDAHLDRIGRAILRPNPLTGPSYDVAQFDSMVANGDHLALPLPLDGELQQRNVSLWFEVQSEVSGWVLVDHAVARYTDGTSDRIALGWVLYDTDGAEPWARRDVAGWPVQTDELLWSIAGGATANALVDQR